MHGPACAADEQQGKQGCLVLSDAQVVGNAGRRDGGGGKPQEHLLEGLKRRLQRKRDMLRPTVESQVVRGVIGQPHVLSKTSSPGLLDGNVGPANSVDNHHTQVESGSWRTLPNSNESVGVVERVEGSSMNCFTHSEVSALAVLQGTRDELYPVPKFCCPAEALFINSDNPLISEGFARSGSVWLEALGQKGGERLQQTDASACLSSCDMLLLSVQDADTFLQSCTGGAVAQGQSRSIVGQLAAMCSFDEMIDKQRTSTANDLERLPATLQGDVEARLVNRYLVAKSFQRSDANKVFKASDVRPLVWCRKTIHNLLVLHLGADCDPQPWHLPRGILLSSQSQSVDAWSQCGALDRLDWTQERAPTSEKYNYVDVYNFLRDRFRSVWQDLTVQHCAKHRGFIECLEISFRFLVLSEELLCEEKGFNAVQNGDLMNTCLDKLMGGYADSRYSLPVITDALPLEMTGIQRAVLSVLVYNSPYEAEFWAYKVVTTLPHSLDNSNAMLDVYRRIPPSLLENRQLRLAFAAHKAFRDRNACRYFKIMREADYLLGVLLNKFANLVRVSYLEALVSRSSRQHPHIPFSSFCVHFGFQEEKLTTIESFCSKYGLRLEPELDSSSGDWSPTHVNLSEAAKLSTVDLQFKRLRCKHFRSVFLTRRWNELKLSRQRLVDPEFPIQAVLSKELQPLETSASELLGSSAASTLTVEDSRKLNAPHMLLPRSMSNEKPVHVPKSCVMMSSVRHVRRTDGASFSQAKSVVLPLETPAKAGVLLVELRYPFEGLVTAPFQPSVAKESTVQWDHSHVATAGPAVEVTGATPEVAPEDSECLMADNRTDALPRFGITDSELSSNNGEEVEQPDVCVQEAPQTVVSHLKPVEDYPDVVAPKTEHRVSEQVAQRGIVKRKYQEQQLRWGEDFEGNSGAYATTFTDQAEMTVRRKRRFRQDDKELSAVPCDKKPFVSKTPLAVLKQEDFPDVERQNTWRRFLEPAVLKCWAVSLCSKQELSVCRKTSTSVAQLLDVSKPSAFSASSSSDPGAQLLKNGVTSVVWRVFFSCASSLVPVKNMNDETVKAVWSSCPGLSSSPSPNGSQHPMYRRRSSGDASSEVSSWNWVPCGRKQRSASYGTELGVQESEFIRSFSSLSMDTAMSHLTSQALFVLRLFELLYRTLEKPGEKTKDHGTSGRKSRATLGTWASVQPCVLKHQDTPFCKTELEQQLVNTKNAKTLSDGEKCCVALSSKIIVRQSAKTGEPFDAAVGDVIEGSSTSSPVVQASLHFLLPAKKSPLWTVTNDANGILLSDMVVADLEVGENHKVSNAAEDHDGESLEGAVALHEFHDLPFQTKVPVLKMPPENVEELLNIDLSASHCFWVLSHPVLAKTSTIGSLNLRYASSWEIEVQALLRTLSYQRFFRGSKADVLGVTVGFALGLDEKLFSETYGAYANRVAGHLTTLLQNAWDSELQRLSGEEKEPLLLSVVLAKRVKISCFCVAECLLPLGCSDGSVSAVSDGAPLKWVERFSNLRVHVPGVEEAFSGLRESTIKVLETAIRKRFTTPLSKWQSSVDLRHGAPFLKQGMEGSKRPEKDVKGVEPGQKDLSTQQPLLLDTADFDAASDCPPYLDIFWEKRVESAPPLTIISSWKREVEQYCPSGSSHPTVLELVQLLPQALHRIASSPYFDPLFWDSVESSVPASHEANGFLLKTRVAVHSFFSYLAERTEAILKKRVADLGSLSLAEFQTMGDFMTYVRRTLRLILDAAFSEIVLDLKLQLPYPLAKELNSLTCRPWKGLPFPPQCYRGTWSLKTQTRGILRESSAAQASKLPVASEKHNEGTLYARGRTHESPTLRSRQATTLQASQGMNTLINHIDDDYGSPLSRSRERAEKNQAFAFESTRCVGRKLSITEATPFVGNTGITSDRKPPYSCCSLLPPRDSPQAPSDSLFVFHNPRGRILGGVAKEENVNSQKWRCSSRATAFSSDEFRVQQHHSAVQSTETSATTILEMQKDATVAASELFLKRGSEGVITATNGRRSTNSCLLGPLLNLSADTFAPGKTSNASWLPPAEPTSDDPLAALKRRLTRSLQKLREELKESEASLNTASHIWAGNSF